jgi:hypothetical protein
MKECLCNVCTYFEHSDVNGFWTFLRTTWSVFIVYITFSFLCLIVLFNNNSHHISFRLIMHFIFHISFNGCQVERHEYANWYMVPLLNIIFQVRQNSLILVIPLTICSLPIVSFPQRRLNAFFQEKYHTRSITFTVFYTLEGYFDWNNTAWVTFDGYVLYVPFCNI